MSAFRALRKFSEVLATEEHTPQQPSDLRPRHLAALRLAIREPRLEQALKGLLRRCLDGYNNEFIASLRTKAPPRVRSAKASYTQTEMRRILRAARADVRDARTRIRAGREHLERWRQGAFDGDRSSSEWHRGWLLDHLSLHGDVPRLDDGKVDVPALAKAEKESVADAFADLFLDNRSVVAFHILLIGLTGQNSGTVAHARASHHRVDADTSGSRVAVVQMTKPRRPKSRARMSVPLTDVPRWIPAGDGTPPEEARELASPFGVYLLLVELGNQARVLNGSDSLFAWRAVKGGGGVGGGFRERPPADEHRRWSDLHSLSDDNGAPLIVDHTRLRLTYLQAHDQPVAQSRATLQGEYQIRDRTDLVRYQKVVARTLDERVQEARDTMRLAHLTPADLEEAQQFPEKVADRLGVTPKTLQRLLSGRLDTVLAACKDNTNGPVSPGRSCEASFLLCTGCPCAVALPRHLTAQVAAHDELLARRGEIAPLTWVQRYGAPWARLQDILARHPEGAVRRAREGITDRERELVARLLARELDA